MQRDDLIARLEAAEGPERILLVRAYEAINGTDHIDYKKWQRFEQLLDAQAALAALREAGFAVVPVEPTSQMLWDGQESYGDKFYFNHQHVANCYRAMIAAAKGEG